MRKFAWISVAAIFAVAVIGLALPDCSRPATGQASKEVDNGTPRADCGQRPGSAHPMLRERLLRL